MFADLILHTGLFTTLDRSNPNASAVAIKDGKFLAVGDDEEIMAFKGPDTKVVDLKGKRVLPGLIDNHTHVIRGGLNFNMELRWDGVRSLADAMDMLKRQVANTPAPQWVRVVGGFTEHQFAEKRLPTIDEINAIAPDTPVFLLHLYDRALLNGAAVRAVGYNKDTPNPPGGEIIRDASGNPTGLLLAKPNAGILYSTLAKGPKLPLEYQVNSTRHFMRELNRLGVTGVIDAGGGFQNYPDDYAVIQKLADENQMTVRLAYNLFTQKPKAEKEDFLNWTSRSNTSRATIISVTTEPAKCWSSPPPTSRISASPAPTCRRRWKARWKRWFASSPKTAGRGVCMPPTTKPSRVRSTSSRRSTRTFRSRA
jgi:predicted amidohydrolase YtcJ